MAKVTESMVRALQSKPEGHHRLVSHLFLFDSNSGFNLCWAGFKMIATVFIAQFLQDWL